MRDGALVPLVGLLSARRTAGLTYDDVAAVDPRTRYIEARRTVRARPHSMQMVPIDDDTAALLEDYLNAQPMPHAIPFEDFRPDTGSPYLFPSPRSSHGLSQWTISRIVRRLRRAARLRADAPASDKKVASHGGDLATRPPPRGPAGAGAAAPGLPARPGRPADR